VGAAVAAEEDDPAARRVERHRVAVPRRRRRGRKHLIPGEAVPDPGVAREGGAVPEAAEEDDLAARGVVGHRVPVARREELRLGPRGALGGDGGVEEDGEVESAGVEVEVDASCARLPEERGEALVAASVDGVGARHGEEGPAGVVEEEEFAVGAVAE
jgi:hypothetical protein